MMDCPFPPRRMALIRHWTPYIPLHGIGYPLTRSPIQTHVFQISLQSVGQSRDATRCNDRPSVKQEYIETFCH